MRRIAWLVACGLLFAQTQASAYPRVARRNAFGAYLIRLGAAAQRNDVRALRRLASHDIAVGEEIVVGPRQLSRDAPLRRALTLLAARGACYRTTPTQIQCELPDPGPNLDHTKLASSTIALFNLTGHGWKLIALYG
jgi:hypothetical protein